MPLPTATRWVSPTNAVNATLYDRLSFNFLRDIAPVAGISREANILAMHPSVPATTVPEFIAHAMANPGKISMASAGIGSAGHMAGELFKMMTGVDLAHVPYRGLAPALTDLIAGQVHVCFANLPASIEYVRAGKLRALAVTTTAPSDALPDVPTVAKYVPGYEASTLFGLGVPRETPTAIVELLNREVNAGLLDQRFQTRVADLGSTVLSGSPADFGALMAAETEKWAKVIRAGKIKAE